jgi:hypothetical protein
VKKSKKKYIRVQPTSIARSKNRTKLTNGLKMIQAGLPANSKKIQKLSNKKNTNIFCTNIKVNNPNGKTHV